MVFFLVLGLLIGAITIIFALQNVAIISVLFFTWQVSGSLSIILLIAMLSGVLICVLVGIPSVIKTHMEFSELKRKNKQLEDENTTYRRTTENAIRSVELNQSDSII